MKFLLLLLLLPLVLLAACGDDDDDSGTSEPDSTDAESAGDGYVGGLRDTQLALNDVVNDPSGGPADGGPAGGDPASYRAQAAAYRAFIAGLEALDPPADAVEAQGALIAATLALASDLDMLADAIENGDSAAEELWRGQVVSNTVTFLATCEAVGLADCDQSAPHD